jgi:ribosomal protein L7/L12
MPAPLSPEELARLRELLQQGKMIEAIKHFRASAGGSLAEAKQALEQLSKSLQAERLGEPSERQPNPARLREVRAALADGNKIEAIKRYRKATGVGLKDAKDAVDRMELENCGVPKVNLPAPGSLPTNLPTNAPMKTGCFGMIVACAVPLAAAAGWLLSR